MLPERPLRPAPRERTFAQLFPWRNVRKAMMLVLLIVAIVVIKRSTGGFFARLTELVGATNAPSPASSRTSQNAVAPVPPPAIPGPADGR